jgi:hypothetical protein
MFEKTPLEGQSSQIRSAPRVALLDSPSFGHTSLWILIFFCDLDFLKPVQNFKAPHAKLITNGFFIVTRTEP